MKIAHLDAELGSASGRAVGDEHSRDGATTVGVLLKHGERAGGVGVSFEVVVPAEPLAEVPLEQETKAFVVDDDREDRLAGRERDPTFGAREKIASPERR
jgi:hypothetical protein